MNLSSVRPLLTVTANYFENRLILPFTTQQKKIIVIAASILGIVLSYVFYRCYFKAKVVSLPDGKNGISARGGKEDLISKSQQHFLSLRDSARDLYTEERWAEATEKYEKALAIKPEDPEILMECAHALERQEKWVKATEKYEKALAIEPQSAYLLGNSAYPLEQQGKWEKAAAKYEQILKTYPDSPLIVRMKYANSLSCQDRDLEAIAQYEEFLKTRPTDFYALVGCADVLGKQKKWAAAVIKYELAFKKTVLDKWNITYANNYANALYYLYRYSEAKAVCQQILKIEPTHLNATLLYAHILTNQGQYKSATVKYQRYASFIQKQAREEEQRIDAILKVIDDALNKCT